VDSHSQRGKMKIRVTKMNLESNFHNSNNNDKVDFRRVVLLGYKEKEKFIKIARILVG